jgi:hypothetical protein
MYIYIYYFFKIRAAARARGRRRQCQKRQEYNWWVVWKTLLCIAHKQRGGNDIFQKVERGERERGDLWSRYAFRLLHWWLDEGVRDMVGVLRLYPDHLQSRRHCVSGHLHQPRETLQRVHFWQGLSNRPEHARRGLDHWKSNRHCVLIR